MTTTLARKDNYFFGLTMETLNCINGRWQAAQDGREFEIRNPADDSPIAKIPDGGAADARLAADAAAGSLEAWKARRAPIYAGR